MNKPSAKNVTVLARIIVCTLILTVGIGVTRFLASRKKPPQEREFQERTLLVSGVVAEPGSYEIPVRGFGELRAVNAIAITPQVSGLVTSVHPRLDEGQTIPADEVLFALDDREYRAHRDETAAAVAVQKETIDRLKAQLELDSARLTHLIRNHELAYTQWQRNATLFNEQQVGMQADVEAAERAYIQALDQTAMLDSSVRQYPAMIREAQGALRVLEARGELAALNLERCVVNAPVRGRVTQAGVEVGQLVGPGQSLIALADDSELELHVPLDSRDAQTRLQMQAESVNALADVPCRVQWTEAAGPAAWTGRLHRIVRVDATTRTLVVAIRLHTHEVAQQSGHLPREGMFCRVDIPAAPLKNVFKLPRSAVNFEGEAFISVSNKLTTVTVDVVRVDGDEVYVSEGIAPGTRVITTRLINPLDGTRLEWKDVSR